MARVQIHRISVEFDDCDPAQIAFFANFFRWYDAASRHFFEKCGVPPWRELERTAGIIGTPVVDAHCRFFLPTTYGDIVEVGEFNPSSQHVLIGGLRWVQGSGGPIGLSVRR